MKQINVIEIDKKYISIVGGYQYPIHIVNKFIDQSVKYVTYKYWIKTKRSYHYEVRREKHVIEKINKAMNIKD